MQIQLYMHHPIALSSLYNYLLRLTRRKWKKPRLWSISEVYPWRKDLSLSKVETEIASLGRIPENFEPRARPLSGTMDRHAPSLIHIAVYICIQRTQQRHETLDPSGYDSGQRSCTEARTKHWSVRDSQHLELTLTPYEKWRSITWTSWAEYLALCVIARHRIYSSYRWVFLAYPRHQSAANGRFWPNSWCCNLLKRRF
jgi:hypothetical protein